MTSFGENKFAANLAETDFWKISDEAISLWPNEPTLMGYDLHITRKKFWADTDGPTITAEEWLAYVATDAQLQLDPKSKRHSVTMKIQSQYPDPWLEWFDGDIYTKNPDEPILAKMLQIAGVLNARVQGDDGEIYRSANFEDTYQEE